MLGFADGVPKYRTIVASVRGTPRCSVAGGGVSLLRKDKIPVQRIAQSCGKQRAKMLVYSVLKHKYLLSINGSVYFYVVFNRVVGANVGGVG